MGAIASSLRQVGDQLLREQELQRLLAYAARAGRGLSATEIAETAKAALPEKGDSMALTLAEKWFAEGRDEGLAEGLHAAIEDALRDRFGDAGLALLPRVRQMSDLTELRAVLRRIWQVSKIDELRSAIDG